MARKRGGRSSKSVIKESCEIDTEYVEEVEVTDPATGKKIIQKVKVTRFKPIPNAYSNLLDGLDELTVDDIKVEEE
jgi:hypothetical protein